MHFIDYVIVSIYLLLVVIVGLLFQRKASQGIEAFFLGNRKLPWWVLGASGMTSNMDIAGGMIAVALIYALGTAGFFIEIRGGVVLIMAFFMIFMGKWIRRSQVMTAAEWMHLRFGKNRQGDTARILSAFSNIIFTIAMISFFAIGSGKFASEFLQIDWKIAALIMTTLALIYATTSGLYGVVWTDLFQGFFVLILIFYVGYLAFVTVNLPEQFYTSVPMEDGTYQTISMTLAEWTRLFPPLKLDLPGVYSMYNLFALSLVFYFFKVTLEGASGGSQYMVQRYFAAASDRDAGILSMFWVLLLMLKWPFAVSIALLGIHYGITHAVIANPEMVLPVVINHYLPIGIKGLVIAAFMAAAMSTFDSTVNAGAAYWVKDIYQGFLNPEANERQLMFQSRISTIMIVVLGILLSFTVANINELWGWITMVLSAGILIPQFLRWYWARFNGYGYAIGTATGILMAIIIRFSFSELPEPVLFLAAGLISFAGCIFGALMTPKTSRADLMNFYKKTRPFGLWKDVRSSLPHELQTKINRENKRDIVSLLIAIIWQLSLFVTGMMVVMKQWDNMVITFVIFCISSVILYFTWFRYLNDEVDVDVLNRNDE